MKNNNKAIDLRSDTVTKPTPGMMQAIQTAEVGDDVLGDDPTVIRLQERIADMLGKDASLYVPSGSMANLLAIRSQTEAGDEVIAHEYSHIYQYEAGSFAVIANCSISLLHGSRGQFEVEDVEKAIRPRDEHFPPSRLLVIENTQNKGGGSVWPMDRIERITNRAHELDLRCHLDGARLMNACIASRRAAQDYARHFDTVSMCFSKGLGAPVGSIIAGSRETIARAHRFRKMLGGAMRQSGLLAAAALYALDHHVDRLAEDHINARRLAETLAEMSGISINVDEVETNIVYFDVIDGSSSDSAEELVRRLEEAGVRMLTVGRNRIRAVTHLDAAGERIDRAIDIIKRELGK